LQKPSRYRTITQRSYIGEEEHLGKSIATQSLTNFIQSYVFKDFIACFVDPNTANEAAIRTYKKAGFKIVKEIPELAVTWMVNEKLNFA